MSFVLKEGLKSDTFHACNFLCVTPTGFFTLVSPEDIENAYIHKVHLIDREAYTVTFYYGPSEDVGYWVTDLEILNKDEIEDVPEHYIRFKTSTPLLRFLHAGDEALMAQRLGRDIRNECTVGKCQFIPNTIL